MTISFCSLENSPEVRPQASLRLKSNARSRSCRPLSVRRTLTWRSSAGSRMRWTYPMASSFLRIGVRVLDSRKSFSPRPLTVWLSSSQSATMVTYWV
ncbi:hypothetical protein D9M71_581350 [compost metagenome]